MTNAANLQRLPGHDDGESMLFEIVRTRSFRRGKFTLASGRESELYFNLKPTMMNPTGALLWAKAFLSRIRAERAEFVGGLEMGAVPVLGAIAAIGALDDRPMKTFFVRKTVKAHGTQDLIEGLGPDETLSGKRVVVVDDVATTGGSIMQAAQAAREAGATIEAALVLVDREEGAAGFLQEHGIKLLSVFRGREFL